MSDAGGSFMLTVALTGFERALRRHEQAYGSGSASEVFIPTAECIYWTAVIDEQLWTWPGYEDASAGLDGGHLLPALRYARNIKTHQLPLTLRRVKGLQFPITFPMSFSEVVWLSADELPEPTNTNRRTIIQRTAYEDYLAGRPTRHTLNELAKYFATLRLDPECPLAAPSSDE